MSKKLCINCKHHELYKEMVNGVEVDVKHVCRRPNDDYDLVTGEEVEIEERGCYYQRFNNEDEVTCGQEGKFYEEK